MNKQTYILDNLEKRDLKKYLNFMRGADDKTVRVFSEYYEQTERHITELEWANIEQSQYHNKKIQFYIDLIRNYRLMLRVSKQYANYHTRYIKRAK